MLQQCWLDSVVVQDAYQSCFNKQSFVKCYCAEIRRKSEATKIKATVEVEHSGNFCILATKQWAENTY